LVVHIADFRDHTETRYALRPPSGRLRPLRLTSDPAIPAGARVKVWGSDEREAIRVARIEREAADVDVLGSALLNPTPKPVLRWAFVLVDLGAGVSLTTDAARQRIFSTSATSIRTHYQQDSYGIQDLNGEVFGPLRGRITDCSDAEIDDLAQTLRPMVPGTFDQYLWFFGREVNNCEWSGVADGGSAVRPAHDSWFNGSTDCGTLVQEPGHNFGMNHSSSLRCTRGATRVPFVTETDGTCTHNEYGHPFDPMGDGCGHMDSYQKGYEDWMQGCNFVKVTGSGTFTLFPIENPCNGVQALQIPLPAPRRLTLANGGGATTLTSYYLELRTPVGLDAKVPLGVEVLVAGDIRDARRFGGHNWLLDMTPETTTRGDVALPVGRTYADPAPNGPKFTVISADNTKAIVRIDMGDGNVDRPGGGTCDDGTPFTAPGPEMCAAAAPTPMPTDGGTATPPRDAGGGTRADASAAADSGPVARADAGSGSGGAGGSPGSGTPDARKADPGGTGGAAGSEGGGGAGGKTGGNGVSGGCGCHLASEPPGGALAISTALVAFALARRRRQRR
jgi:MYXO-CTERM domain-containing protein